jgi:hypothetical protein
MRDAQRNLAGNDVLTVEKSKLPRGKPRGIKSAA